MPKFCKKGVADILGCLDDGAWLAIEVKKPKSYPTKDQREFLTQIRKRGGVAFVARSLEEVMQWWASYQNQP